jgi:hypothetical protein
MSSEATSITVVIPSLDPLGKQLMDLIDTIDSIQAALAEFRHEILVIAPEQACDRIFPTFLEQRFTLLAETAPGHSNALNTGTHAARHQHLLVLNPGDQLLSSPKLRLALSNLNSSTIYSFRVVSEYGYNGGAFPPCRATPIGKYVQLHGLKVFSYMPHQGLLMPISLLKNSTLCYSELYNLRMDFDFLLQLAKSYTRTLLTAEAIPIAYYPPGGVSQLIDNQSRFFLEEIKITWGHKKIVWPSTLAKLIRSFIVHAATRSLLSSSSGGRLPSQ